MSVETASTKGIKNTEYITGIVQKLANQPAYRIANFSDRPEDEMVHVECVLETCRELDLPIPDLHTVNPRVVPYRAFIALMRECIFDEMDKVENVSHGKGLSLHLDSLCRELLYSKKSNDVVRQLLNINYGSFVELVGALDKPFADDSYLPIMKKYTNLTYEEVIKRTHTKTKWAWGPGESIGDYAKNMLHAYGEIYFFIYRPLALAFDIFSTV